MNPFRIEGIDISINAWRWLYLNQNTEIAVPSSKVTLDYLNAFVRHGLLVYKQRRFHLTDFSREVLSRVKQYEKDLQLGVPLIERDTFFDLSLFAAMVWLQGKTREKKPFITNKDIIIFTESFRHLNPFVSEDTLDVEVVISQAQKAIFAECHIEVFPRVFQRKSFFEPGAIWFRSSVGDPTAISEQYYDMVMTLSNRSLTEPTFYKLWLDREYIVAINPFVASKYFEDIIALVPTISNLEGLESCAV